MGQGGTIPGSEGDELGKQGKPLWEVHGEVSRYLLKLIPMQETGRPRV